MGARRDGRRDEKRDGKGQREMRKGERERGRERHGKGQGKRWKREGERWRGKQGHYCLVPRQLGDQQTRNASTTRPGPQSQCTLALPNGHVYARHLPPKCLVVCTPA